ncbi:aminotransferase class I/II-fold pyridoxal phosphate-dependent enzyme, partial [bacterium]|nr:aminotransferase class I/II-fold pyridoxal phosphate-dependent enzyme [bacterium]
IRAFFDLVIGMKDVISLGVGEPDFVTPWNVREAAVYSLGKGYTSYTSNAGLLELRDEIARFLSLHRGISNDPKSQILVTVGVSEGIDLAMRALLNPGDEVIIPEPAFVAYAPMVTLAGGTPVILDTWTVPGFKVTPAALEKAVTKRTKALLLNYPSNPTGTSYTRGELLGIAGVVKKHDLLMITDEVYDLLSYDLPHVATPSLPGMHERTLYLNGFSKGFAMTGFRLGYACGPAPLIAAMTKVHQYTLMCASITAQMAGIEALRHGLKDAKAMAREYDRRRRMFVKGLNEAGLECHMPGGAFYAFPSVRKTGVDGMTFARRLLETERVAVVPGTAFGKGGKDYVRMAYASSYDDLKEALVRMARFIKSLRNG